MMRRSMSIAEGPPFCRGGRGGDRLARNEQERMEKGIKGFVRDLVSLEKKPVRGLLVVELSLIHI